MKTPKLCVLAAVWMLALGCKREAPAPAPTPTTAATADAGPAQGAAAPAPTPPAPPAPRTFRGTFTGRGVDPPLRALDPTMVVDPWNANGTAELVLPPGEEGPVTGTLRAEGLVMAVRGWRSGAGVRAMLEPVAETDAGTTGVWRGMLDVRLEGDALTGSWRASADAGRVARAGTVTARYSASVGAAGAGGT